MIGLSCKSINSESSDDPALSDIRRQKVYSVKEYRFAATLDEAYQLLQASPRSALFAGGTWMRLGKRAISTAIDLSRLGLDRITETDAAVEIGACVTLRQLETEACLKTLFGGVLSDCVSHIVGVQFRNMAMIGSSVYSRFGFSDLITALLALEAEVQLFHAGAMPLSDFLRHPPKRDILTCVRVPKSGRRAVYLSQRRTETDFALLTVCASRTDKGDWLLSVGARPGVAALCPEAARLMQLGDIEAAAKAASDTMTYDDNTRASADYRRALAAVLTRRALTALQEVKA